MATEAWSILGAWQSIDDSGMVGKDLRLLRVGDGIDIITSVYTD